MFNQDSLDKHRALDNRMFQLLSEDGKPLEKGWKPSLSNEEIVQAYKIFCSNEPLTSWRSVIKGRAECSLIPQILDRKRFT
jgi:hypothetical protein